MNAPVSLGEVTSPTSPAAQGARDEIAVMRSLLAVARSDNKPAGGIQFLQYGSGPLADHEGCWGLLIADAAVSVDRAASGTLTLDAAGGLPAFETVALLSARSETAANGNEGWTVAQARAWRVETIDVFSIGRGRYANEICRWCRRPEFRPFLIRLERAIATASEEAILDSRGYRRVAAGADSLVYTRSPGLSRLATESLKPSIRTFDIFDTLIARRCVRPDGIFATIGAAIGHAGFVELRKQAEADVYGNAYTLRDIYERMAAIAGLTTNEIDALEELELKIESLNAIPIQENVCKVGPSDILVSDMYLSADQVADLLKAAGLTGKNPILVRPRGKIDGTSWVDLKEKFSIAQHLGDDQHADYNMALHHGIPARLTSTANVSRIEDAIVSRGFPCLARTMREARLRTYSDDPTIRHVQDLQTQINFPLLVIAGLHLARIVEDQKYDVVLMTSRDCNLWINIIRHLAEAGRFTARPIYLQANRNLLREPAPSYLRYIKSLNSSRPLFVDLVGTGLSTQIFSRFIETPLDSYLINDIAKSAYAEAEATRLRTNLRPVAHSLSRTVGQNSDLIEAINMDTCGPLIDVAEVGATFIPRREPSDLPPHVLRQVQAMHEAFGVCLQAMGFSGLDDVVRDTSLLEQIGDNLLTILQEQDGGALIDYHRRDELMRREMKMRAALVRDLPSHS